MLHRSWVSPRGIPSSNTLSSIRTASISTIPVINATCEDIATFESTIVQNRGFAHGGLGCHIIFTITALETVRRDEDIEKARCYKCTHDENDNHMHEHKTVDKWWIVGVTVEKFRVRKREYQRYSRTGDVLEANWPNPMNFPILGAAEDGTVKVSA